jgi:hypothetical protein
MAIDLNFIKIASTTGRGKSKRECKVSVEAEVAHLQTGGGVRSLPLTLLQVLELSAASELNFSATPCVCATRLGRLGKPFIHFFLVGEQLLDARALLHALEMRRGYCISANFIESSSSVHPILW